MSEKRRGVEKRQETVPLDGAGIDRLSELLAEALMGAETDRKDVLRLRLALEEILALWERVLGGGTPCVFQCGTRLGRMYVYVTAEGRRVDPGEMGSEETEGLLCSGLLAQAGLSLTYTYKDGINRLEMYPAKPRRLSSLAQLVLSIAAAVAVGLLCLALLWVTLRSGGGMRLEDEEDLTRIGRDLTGRIQSLMDAAPDSWAG